MVDGTNITSAEVLVYNAQNVLVAVRTTSSSSAIGPANRGERATVGQGRLRHDIGRTSQR
jgi:hypothetical protein